MSGFRVRPHVVLGLSAAASLFLSFGCDEDRGGNPMTPDLPAPPTNGSLLIAPIAGLTTSWHEAPPEVVIPVGTEVVLLATAANDAKFTWVGAREIEATGTSSKASCPVEDAGMAAISVRVTMKENRPRGGDGGTRAKLQGTDSEIDRTYSCVLHAMELRPEDIVVSPVAITGPFLDLNEASSNEDTYRAFLGNSVADIREIGDGHYLTSIDREVSFAVAVEPAGIAPLVEWRIEGEPARLGAEQIHTFSTVGRHRISAGPPTRATNLIVDTYSVSLTDANLVPDGQAVTLHAVTDPPGFEHLISWISSTKYGTGSPVLGSGDSFTVRFDNTFGPDGFQWLGVRADNAVLNQDQKIPPPPPGTSLALFQLDLNLDGTPTANSDWGHVDVVFPGQTGVLYFNLNINGSWQVENIPVLSVDGPISQRVTHSFSLGVSPGVQVGSVNAGFSLTADTLTSMPPATGQVPVGDRTIIEYSGIQGQTLTYSQAAPLLGGGGDGAKHTNEGVPNQECGTLECGPAAVSNSLKFLKAKHNLNIPDADITIDKMKQATGWTAGGCPVGWFNTKNTYMQNNNIPITTTSTNNIADVITALDNNCDVELDATRHIAAIVGVQKLKDGKYAVTVAHDTKQNEAGGTIQETGTYDPATGVFTGITWVNNDTICGFVIECPSP